MLKGGQKCVKSWFRKVEFSLDQSGNLLDRGWNFIRSSRYYFLLKVEFGIEFTTHLVTNLVTIYHLGASLVTSGLWSLSTAIGL